MAGDWIKMRSNLWDDPRIARVCDLLDCTEASVVGGLYWLWATADQHTETGILPGLTLRQIDRKTGIPGFGQALCDIGWIADHHEGVRIIRFEEHNGASAKRRCSDAQRKANSRGLSASDADTTRTDDGQDADEMRRIAELEKEKRREEKKPSSLRSEEARKRAPAAVAASVLVEAGLSEDLAKDFIAHKDRLKAPLTDRAWADHQREAQKAGWSAADAAEKTIARSWKGFEAKYVADERPPARAAPVSFRERERQAAEAQADAWGGPELAAFRRKATETAEVIDVTPRRLG